MWIHGTGSKLRNSLNIYQTLGVYDPLNTPAAREAFGYAYDDVREIFYVFGGVQNTVDMTSIGG